mgnify:CR=1 FL=1
MQAFKKVDMESWPRREHYRYYTEALKVEFNMTARWMCKTCSVSVMHTAINSTQRRFTASPRRWAASRTSACSKTRTANSVSGIKSCRISRSFIRMTARFPTAGRTFPRISPRFTTPLPRIWRPIRMSRASRPNRISLRISTAYPARRGRRFTGCGSRVADDSRRTSHRCHGQIRKMRRKGQYAGQYHHCTCGGRWIPRRFVLPVSAGGTGCPALNVQNPRFSL